MMPSARNPEPRNVPTSHTVGGAVKATVAIVVGGVVLYVVYVLAGPLMKLASVTGSAVDAVAGVAGDVVDASKFILGMPEKWWSTMTGGTKWRPNPQWTPDFVAQHPGDLSYLNVVEVITTWSYVMVAANGGKTVGLGGYEPMMKWFNDNKVMPAVTVLRDAIMHAYGWKTPITGAAAMGALDMKKAGHEWSLHDGGNPMDKLYRGTATLAEAGPDHRDETKVTSGYLVVMLWGMMFPQPTQSVVYTTTTPAGQTAEVRDHRHA